MNTIRRSLILFALLIVLYSSFSLTAESFVIDHYQIDMLVRENNSYDITETIDVDFSSERHGLIRDIPLGFDDMFVEVSHITVPGYKSRVEREGDRLSIRIGSADTWVKGKMRYVISYTYDVGADKLKHMDEFNHNLIGLHWATTIDSADFSITLPKAFDPEKVNCTSGAYGSTDNSSVEWVVSGTTISGHLLKPLNNYEGLTVALPLPEGYWVGAASHRKPGWLFSLITGYPLYGLVIILSFLLWFFKGRDNQLFPSVEFEPPQGLTPAEIGYIIDGEVDGKDVTSLILYWAHKGYLAIEEGSSDLGKSQDLTLIKLAVPGADARSYERHIFKKLFSSGTGDRVSTSDLTNSFYKTVSWAQDNITKFFTDNPEKRIYKKDSGGFTFLAGLMAYLPPLFILIQLLSGFNGKGPVKIFAAFLAILVVLPLYQFAKAITGKGSSRKLIIITALLSVISLTLFGLLYVLAAKLDLYRYLAAAGSSFLVCIFAAIMSKRTEYGDKILERVLGFMEFIKSAEKDKLEMMFETNPAYFYDILPYAMVLGLSSKWSSHFKNLTVEPPVWYRGYRYSTFNARDFEKNLSRNFSSLNSSMNSSPSSSGSSGSSSSGGFSGGGSGGGGGSSW